MTQGSFLSLCGAGAILCSAMIIRMFPWEPAPIVQIVELHPDAEAFMALAEAYEHLERARQDSCADPFVLSAERFRIQSKRGAGNALCP